MIAVSSQFVSQSTSCFWEWLFFQFFVSFFFCMLSNMHTCTLSWYLCHLANLSVPPRFHLMQKVTEKLWHKGQSLVKTWFGSGGEAQCIIGYQKIKEVLFPSCSSLTRHTILALSELSSNIYTEAWTLSLLPPPHQLLDKLGWGGGEGSVDKLSISDELGPLFFPSFVSR